MVDLDNDGDGVSLPVVSVCKKESRNENIALLPSSFSHLYRTNPEDLRQEIPRHHQVGLTAQSAGDTVCCLEGHPGHLRRGDLPLPPQQADHHERREPGPGVPLL